MFSTFIICIHTEDTSEKCKNICKYYSLHSMKKDNSRYLEQKTSVKVINSFFINQRGSLKDQLLEISPSPFSHVCTHI